MNAYGSNLVFGLAAARENQALASILLPAINKAQSHERTLRFNSLEMFAKAYALLVRFLFQARAAMPTAPNPAKARVEGSGTATRNPRISPPPKVVE